jgi:hypothetical protein
MNENEVVTNATCSGEDSCSMAMTTTVEGDFVPQV